MKKRCVEGNPDLAVSSPMNPIKSISVIPNHAIITIPPHTESAPSSQIRSSLDKSVAPAKVLCSIATTENTTQPSTTINVSNTTCPLPSVALTSSTPRPRMVITVKVPPPPKVVSPVPAKPQRKFLPNAATTASNVPSTSSIASISSTPQPILATALRSPFHPSGVVSNTPANPVYFNRKPAVRGRPWITQPVSSQALAQTREPHGINQNHCETVSHIEPQNIKHDYSKNPEVISMCDAGEHFTENPEAIQIEPDEQGHNEKLSQVYHMHAKERKPQNIMQFYDENPKVIAMWDVEEASSENSDATESTGIKQPSSKSPDDTEGKYMNEVSAEKPIVIEPHDIHQERNTIKSNGIASHEMEETSNKNPSAVEIVYSENPPRMEIQYVKQVSSKNPGKIDTSGIEQPSSENYEKHNNKQVFNGNPLPKETKHVRRVSCENQDIIQEENSDMEVLSEVSSNDSSECVSDVELSASDSDKSEYIPNWTQNFQDIDIKPFVGKPQSGPNLPEGFDTTTAHPHEYFQLFFTDEMFANFATYTNNCAKIKTAQKKQAKSDTSDYKWPIDGIASEGMKAYFGVNIIMGINPLPQYDMYWSSDKFIGNSGIKKTFPLGVYEKLQHFLKVSDNIKNETSSTDRDKFSEVRPLLENCSVAFEKSFYPSEHQVIHESVSSLMESRSSLKLYMRIDGMHPYVHQVYLPFGNKIHGELFRFNIVDNLAGNLYGKHHTVVMNEQFSHVGKLKELLEHGVYAVGAVKAVIRHLPAEMQGTSHTALPHGVSQVFQDVNNPNITVWRVSGERESRYLSTCCKPGATEQQITFEKGDTSIVLLPHCSNVYTKVMSNVERHEQMLKQFSVGIFSKTTWKSLLWFLVDCALVNAFVICKLASTWTPKNAAHNEFLEFKIEVARGLIAGYTHR